MLADRASTQVAPDHLALRIHTEGQITDEVLAELGSLDVRPMPDGFVFQGPVTDLAELWGVLHRLHRAGLKLSSLERFDEPHQSGTHAGLQSPQDGVEVRIDVDGVAAGLLSTLLSGAEAYESPPSTTLVLRVAGDHELFDVLQRLEGLALSPRAIRVGEAT